MSHTLNDILMITHNRPRYTRLALRRLLETCDASCRLWLWHNGNDEETLSVVQEFRANPLIFRFHHSEENAGQNAPLRWIFEAGNAPYVSKVDDDCLMPHGWLDKLRQAHEDVPEFGAIGCWRFPDDLFIPEVASRKIQLFGNRHRVMLNCWIEGSGFVLKRECLSAHGNIPTNYSFPRFCLDLSLKGWVHGWYFPFLFQEHMDHPWSPHTMFRSDADLERHSPVNAKRWGVGSLEEYAERFRQEAYALQRAAPNPRLYVGWRARFGRACKLLGRQSGRQRQIPTPLLEKLRPLRDKYQPGLKLYYRSPWVNRKYVSERPIMLIGGAERSGTTLLRASVESHPDIAIGPESWVFVYRPDLSFLATEYDFRQDELQNLMAKSTCLSHFVDLFAAEYCRRQERPFWGEKSPHNVFRLSYIWKHFPNARFVHIIRDGRDVACSLRNHPRHVRIGQEYFPTQIRRPIGNCIDKWARAVRAGIRHRHDPRYLEVRYEDLVTDYEGATRRIIDHLGVEWHEELLRREEIQETKRNPEIVNPEVRGPLYTHAVARWKKDLSEAELATIESHAGQLLRSLGYE